MATALSPDAETLTAARALHGVTGATLAPSAAALIGNMSTRTSVLVGVGA